MLHPTVKSRLIYVRRLFLHTLIEVFLKILGALLTAGIDDVTIPLRDHLRLSVAGITLNCFNIATGQDQLIADTAMPQTVKGYDRKSKLQQLLFQQTGQCFLREGPAIGIP